MKAVVIERPHQVAGGYGEYVRVPRHVVHLLPETASFAAGALRLL